MTKYASISPVVLSYVVSASWAGAVHAQRVRLTPVAAARNLVKRVAPDYPEDAKKQKIQATVLLQVEIDKRGNVTDAKPVRGDPILVQAAVNAVKKWMYRPVMLNGFPVKVETKVEVRFTFPK